MAVYVDMKLWHHSGLTFALDRVSSRHFVLRPFYTRGKSYLYPWNSNLVEGAFLRKWNHYLSKPRHCSIVTVQAVPLWPSTTD